MRRLSFSPLLAACLAVFGVAGLLDAWGGLPAVLLLPGLLWLPGAVLARAAEARWHSDLLGRGPGRIAAESTAGLVLFLPAVAPLFLSGAGLGRAAGGLGLIYVVTGLGALWLLRGELPSRRSRTEASAGVDWLAVTAVTAVLLPLVLGHAGGTVDDWWDMAFVAAWSEAGTLGFAEPFLGTGLSHPRFLWNGWLLLQALIVRESGISAHGLQSGLLAAAVCLLSVSAQAGFARTLFGASMPVARVATILSIPCWLLATEAIPYFTRLHQDKFVVALVLVPVMLSAALAYLRGRRPLDLILLAVAAAAACSVHSLVYSIGLLGVLVCAAALLGRGLLDAGNGARAAAVRLTTASALPLLYPLSQAWLLSARLDAQGVSLAAPDNPVVRAHLWLGRLAGADGFFYVVDPRAVFGPFVVVAVVGLLVACSKRRRAEPSSKVLVGLTLLPLALACVPGLAALTGTLMLPWMLYRLLWLVPVAALAGLAFDRAFALEPRRRSGVAVAVLVAVTLVAVVPTTEARYQRGMQARGSERPHHPRGTTLEVLGFLADSPERGPVLAPAGLSEVIPALAARPVVAMSERATLVFSSDETGAYRRVYDRAQFFSSTATRAERARVAARYGVRQAVFRSNWVTQGSEVRLMSRFAVPGVLLSAADRDWSADPARLLPALPEGSRTLLRNADFILVEWPELERPELERPELERPVPASGVDWVAAVGVDLDEGPGGAGGSRELLGSTAGWPGIDLYLEPRPLSLGTSPKLIWMRGLASWDDGPTEARIRLELARRCRLESVDLVPFMRKKRRQLLEIRTGASRRTVRAFDGVPVRVMLDQPMTGALDLHVRSLLGTPVGFSEISLFGDRADCAVWRAWGVPSDAASRMELDHLLQTSALYPNSARAGITLARRLADSDMAADGEALLRFSLARDPSVANAWVELGLMRDLQGGHRQALAAYRRAVRLDSKNAWARGCLAWARLRAGRPLAALYQVYHARRLDPRYADAHTILARIKRDFGLRDSARSSLRRAIEMDRRRNWAYMELAGMLVAEGETVAALRVLDDFLLIEPEDESVRELRASMLAKLRPG